jgi:putative hemolysin
MKLHAWTGLLLVLLLATACAALPPAAPEPTQPSAAIANPASQNCLSQGGKLQIEQRGDGGQYGVCYFEDNQQCEEWALLRGECPVGGVKVTGYTTEAARFCAISGGEYDQEGGCTFKNGVKCDAEAFHAGTCSPDGATGG